jgi:hypothetical protein
MCGRWGGTGRGGQGIAGLVLYCGATWTSLLNTDSQTLAADNRVVHGGGSSRAADAWEAVDQGGCDQQQHARWWQQHARVVAAAARLWLAARRARRARCLPPASRRSPGRRCRLHAPAGSPLGTWRGGGGSRGRGWGKEEAAGRAAWAARGQGGASVPWRRLKSQQRQRLQQAASRFLGGLLSHSAPCALTCGCGCRGAAGFRPRSTNPAWRNIAAKQAGRLQLRCAGAGRRKQPRGCWRQPARPAALPPHLQPLLRRAQHEAHGLDQGGKCVGALRVARLQPAAAAVADVRSGPGASASSAPDCGQRSNPPFLAPANACSESRPTLQRCRRRGPRQAPAAAGEGM